MNNEEEHIEEVTVPAEVLGVAEDDTAPVAEKSKSPRRLSHIFVPLFLIIVVSVGVFITVQGNFGSDEVPDIVREFLDAYLLADRNDPNLDVTTIMQTYIKTSDSTFLTPEEIAQQEGPEFDQSQFDSVFFDYTEGVGNYAIATHSEGYVEIMLSTSLGNVMFPRVGFWYKLSLDKKHITDYTIGRLQPFSTYDPEYVEVWG